ncbi:hypothetical protein CZ771_04475 [Actinomycetales bacterium JB111]|nr:hypothetical protein CZ771_04475 [Actinomycetales bacterium JB111]
MCGGHSWYLRCRDGCRTSSTDMWDQNHAAHRSKRGGLGNTVPRYAVTVW